MKATNTDAEISRETLTDSAGRYRLPQLALGPYSVEIQLHGLESQTKRRITLTVGSEAVVNFALSVAAVTQAVLIVAQAPLAQTTDSTISPW